MVATMYNFHIPQVATGVNDWYADYPNPADFQFDYWKLLNLAKANAIGRAPNAGTSSAPRVAIVGAGVAGMVAARELFRCGYQVTIYEASDRICGRHYTQHVPGQSTGMELGAMRFPFFSEPGSHNSVFDYYLNDEVQIQWNDFPNPGSAPGGTGIFMNNGFGPNDEFYPSRRMIMWPAGQQGPNDAYLQPVWQSVNNFLTFFTGVVGSRYGTAQWPNVWRQIADQYDQMTFSDLVFAPAITSYDNDGWLGGFGMNDLQSQLFYTIGAGDGSWGAFYEIGAMWFIRCVMFGFNSNLKTVAGLQNASTFPYYNDQAVNDSARNPLTPPLYSGIQSLVEYLLYAPPPGMSQSFYSGIHSSGGGGTKLFVDTPVTSITKTASGLRVTAGTQAQTFDHVIVTPQIWATQLGILFDGFNQNDLPWQATSARNEQHLIASCKVFFPLKEPYWENPNCSIPQLIVTDTPVQDAYGIVWNDGDPGVLLASYTWEDDALKLLPLTNAQVAELVLAQLDAITVGTLGQQITPYITSVNDALVWQWSVQPYYNGCAKLYRQRNWSANYALLAYNQQYSAASRLYLAGETFSVEGGWTEPAMRLALDAVIRIIQNSGGTFNNGFNVANDYPTFDVDFTPNYTYDCHK